MKKIFTFLCLLGFLGIFGANAQVTVNFQVVQGEAGSISVSGNGVQLSGSTYSATISNQETFQIMFSGVEVCCFYTGQSLPAGVSFLNPSGYSGVDSNNFAKSGPIVISVDPATYNESTLDFQVRIQTSSSTEPDNSVTVPVKISNNSNLIASATFNQEPVTLTDQTYNCVFTRPTVINSGNLELTFVASAGVKTVSVSKDNANPSTPAITTNSAGQQVVSIPVSTSDQNVVVNIILATDQINFTIVVDDSKGVIVTNGTSTLSLKNGTNELSVKADDPLLTITPAANYSLEVYSNLGGLTNYDTYWEAEVTAGMVITINATSTALNPSSKFDINIEGTADSPVFSSVSYSGNGAAPVALNPYGFNTIAIASGVFYQIIATPVSGNSFYAYYNGISMGEISGTTTAYYGLPGEGSVLNLYVNAPDAYNLTFEYDVIDESDVYVEANGIEYTAWTSMSTDFTALPNTTLTIVVPTTYSVTANGEILNGAPDPYDNTVYVYDYTINENVAIGFWAPGTTGVESIDAADNAPAVIYNLQGVRVNNDNLRPGIYIINGKKVAIR